MELRANSLGSFIVFFHHFRWYWKVFVDSFLFLNWFNFILINTCCLSDSNFSISRFVWSQSDLIIIFVEFVLLYNFVICFNVFWLKVKLLFLVTGLSISNESIDDIRGWPRNIGLLFRDMRPSHSFAFLIFLQHSFKLISLISETFNVLVMLLKLTLCVKLIVRHKSIVKAIKWFV